MYLLQRILVSVIAAFTFVGIYAEATVSSKCLQCVCEGATQCDLSARCHQPYIGGNFCGPFHLSLPFWNESGKPVIGNDNPESERAFERCALDYDCATRSVAQYMNKYGKDCDGDGEVTCKDYVRMHKLGKDDCTAPLPNDRYTYQFEECASLHGLL